VVAETAALLVEELVTTGEGVERGGEGGSVSVGGGAEPVDVQVPCFGLADAEERVRAEGGEDAGGAVGVFDGAVVGEGVGGMPWTERSGCWRRALAVFQMWSAEAGERRSSMSK
jgi:hypothetical protein